MSGNCTPEEISYLWTPTPLVCQFGGSIVHSPWILKEKGPRLIRRLRVTQEAMDRAMLGVYLRDQIINQEIHRRTRVTAIAQGYAMLKWNWMLKGNNRPTN